MAVPRRPVPGPSGVTVGHAVDRTGATGVTVVRFAAAAPTVVDVRGGASATYDTASLAVDATFGRRWALFVAGGSVFGLDAARGIRSEILRRGGGHRAFDNPNRIAPVSGAALFDLPAQSDRLPDYGALGARAARSARRWPGPEGRVGAGAGATVGKYRGRPRAMHGGVGVATVRVPELGVVGVLTVVNAVGAIRDPSSGRWVAGARGPRGELVPPTRPWARSAPARGTTLAVAVTEAPVDRAGLARICAIVHAGLARAIVPFHTATDGDAVFASTVAPAAARRAERRPGTTADRIGSAAAEAAVASVLSAVRRANGLRRPVEN